MQMISLKNKFITCIFGYRGKQTWNRPAGLQLFKKETPTQVFSCGICETFKNSGGCFWKHVTYYYVIKNYVVHKLAIFNVTLLLLLSLILHLLLTRWWDMRLEHVAWLWEERADSRNSAWNKKTYCSCYFILIRIDTILSANI